MIHKPLKASLFLLAFLVFTIGISNAQQVDSVHKEKAKRIIERLTSGKQLQSRFLKEDSLTIKITPVHEHHFAYYTQRIVNGKKVDSVLMVVQVNDAVNVLYFNEFNSWRSDIREDYHYSYYNGIQYSAYNTYTIVGDEQEPEIKMDYTKVLIPFDYKFAMPVVIHADSASLAIERKLQRGTVAFYLPKLLYSIDELYDLLFK